MELLAEVGMGTQYLAILEELEIPPGPCGAGKKLQNREGLEFAVGFMVWFIQVDKALHLENGQVWIIPQSPRWQACP